MNNFYQKTEKILLSQGKFHISLELERIEKVLSLLDDPQDKIKIIHVAGTNGKGSTCTMLSRVLSEQGYRVGLYTSPHLKKYNERIKINGEEITDEDFYRLTKKINDLSKDNNVHLTEFEILTAVMFCYFFEKKVDYAVVEVGLGGRLDATNCIKKPLLTIITSISRDHTERLGETTEEIAFEKAGIIKENTPVIFDKYNSGEKTIKEVAQKRNAKIYNPEKCEITYQNGKNLLKADNDIYELSLMGKYQEVNSALVLCAVKVLKALGVKISETSVKNALKNVKWAGRFQYIKEQNIILDGCHNPDGARVLRESLDFYFPYPQKRIFVYTSLKNKDYDKIQKNLFTESDIVYHFDMKSDNFIKTENLLTPCKNIDIEELKTLIETKNKKDLLIICGSLYALGNILGKIDLCS